MRYSRLLQTDAPASTLLIRLFIGIIATTGGGIQKFLYPQMRGVGRFAEIGFPAPAVVATFVGIVEIVAGVLIIVGLLTRLAAFALVIDFIVAMIATKIPVLLTHGYWIFSPEIPSYNEIWGFLHAWRTDLAMLLGSLYLLLIGAGVWSLDASLHDQRTQSSTQATSQTNS